MDPCCDFWPLSFDCVGKRNLPGKKIVFWHSVQYNSVTYFCHGDFLFFPLLLNKKKRNTFGIFHCKQTFMKASVSPISLLPLRHEYIQEFQLCCWLKWCVAECISERPHFSLSWQRHLARFVFIINSSSIHIHLLKLHF